MNNSLLSSNAEFKNFHQLFDLFPEPIIIGELTGKILWANTSAENFFGYKNEEFSAFSFLDFVTEEFSYKLPDILKVENEKQGLTLEILVRLKNNKVVPCEIKTSILDHRHRKIRCIVFHDLSEKNNKKFEPYIIPGEIDEKTSFIPGIIEEPEMVFELDGSGHFVSINSFCIGKTGYSRNDLEKNLHFSEILVPEDKTRARIDINKIMRGEQLDALEYTIIKKDGSFLPIIVSLTKIFSEGKILGIRGLGFDISEHKKIEKDLIIKEKLNALGEMSSGVVHNINNILAIILGYIELIPKSTLDESCSNILGNIKRAALDGTEIVKRIKNFSHISAQPPDEFHDINRIILDVIELLKPRWNTAGAGITVYTTLDEIPALRVTPYEIREVLSNVIINALDAMPGGGKLTIRSYLDKDHVAISIEDTGTGMSLETKKRLFEPFYTTKKMWGTGIGLSVSYDIIKNLGGEIVVESEINFGTSITILLPKPKENECPSSAWTHEKGSEKQLYILVIDDEENICEILREYLKRDGYNVDTALGYEDGLALFQKKNFDIVITDLNLPSYSGWDIARQVRKEKPDTFIILLTGWETQIDDSNNRERNIDIVLHKPIDFAGLSEIIRQACVKN
jgi:PAS domain S-box-containing protein